MTTSTTYPTIRCTAAPMMIDRWMIVRLPEAASEQLSSRGQVSVVGTIDGHEFRTVLEPDGYWGHYIRPSAALQKAANLRAGETANIEITQVKTWPEPTVPKDFAAALATAPAKVKGKWQDITPMARWEWIRWVNATASTDTRAIRIEKSISKLNGKHRRPCCFNLAACTDMDLAKSARLRLPS